MLLEPHEPDVRSPVGDFRMAGREELPGKDGTCWGGRWRWADPWARWESEIWGVQWGMFAALCLRGRNFLKNIIIFLNSH